MFDEMRDQFNQEFEHLKEANGRLQVLTATAKALSRLNIIHSVNQQQNQLVIPANAIIGSQLFIRPRPYSLTITGVSCLNPSNDLLAEILWTWHKHPREAVYYAPLENAEYNILDLPGQKDKIDFASTDQDKINDAEKNTDSIVLPEEPAQSKIVVCNVLTINLRLPLSDKLLKPRLLADILDESFDQIQEAGERLVRGDYGLGGQELTEQQLIIPKQIDLHLV
jgi:hypothetical protein